jgi:ABC-type multidrug transport system fused ATPase/permease subunit
MIGASFKKQYNRRGERSGIMRLGWRSGHFGYEEVISKLPQGYGTVLVKWFADGVELSVGEWQRLALARVFFRHAPILILHEPTSALW